MRVYALIVNKLSGGSLGISVMPPGNREKVIE